jgi:hypothetical protein
MLSFFTLIFYYLVLPFLLAGLLLRLIKKYGARAADPDVTELYRRHPIERKWFRAARRDGKGLHLLGDCETQGEAVEGAYRGKEAAVKAGEKAAFLVLNDKAEVLEQVES